MVCVSTCKLGVFVYVIKSYSIQTFHIFNILANIGLFKERISPSSAHEHHLQRNQVPLYMTMCLIYINLKLTYMIVTVYYTLNKYAFMQFLSGSFKAYFLNSHVFLLQKPIF